MTESKALSTPAQHCSVGVGTMSSRTQGNVQTTPGSSVKTSWDSLLNVAPLLANDTYITYATAVKAGRKTLLKIASASDILNRQLKKYVGARVTVFIPYFNIAWTTTLSRKKHGGWLYVVVPSRVRDIVEEVWRGNGVLTVLIMIPTTPMTMNRGDG